MASFPDNLPLSELDPFYRALIYLSIFYFFATAFSSWLITRKRAKPIRVERIVKEDKKSKHKTELSTIPISFEDTMDKLASLKVEISGAESSLNLLNNLKNSSEISNEAYSILTSKYNVEVSSLTDQMNDMIKSDIIHTSTGEIEKGISDEEMEDIEADLEKQLLELDGDDDFLKPRSRRKTPISKVNKEKQKSKPVSFTEESKHEKVTVEKPPPMTKAESPVVPPSKPKTPAPTPMATPMAASVKSSTPKAQASSAPKVSAPVAPKPSAPKSSTAIPEPINAETPKASTPKVFTPVSAAQPMRVQAEPEKEQIFAKSTSIAALRMDMLRELARLKKLINEDE